MKKTGIFYGSTTGTTEDIAGQIAGKLGVDKSNVHDAGQLTAELVAGYDALLLGTSTWGDGELQDDWYGALDVLKGADLNGKVVALFGCGDSDSYADTFCDAMGVIYEAIKDKGCKVVGAVDTSGYTFSSSVAAPDGKFVGLAIDEVNESSMTADRIDAWVAAIQPELA